MTVLCVQYGEQRSVRQCISGCGGSLAKVPLFLSGSENTQRPRGGCLWLGHSQLLGRPPQTGLYVRMSAHCIRARLSTFKCALCASVRVFCCAQTSMPFCLLQGLETTGALDLGGASTQISFVSDNYNGSESPSNSVTFRLYGNDYNLYTHSFLCYGKDQALRMTLAHQSQVNFFFFLI